jgi:hypothetical protein
VTGNTCWACRPCLAYAAGITTKMKELEGRLEGVEKKVEDGNREVKGLAKKVERVEEAIKKKDGKVDRAVREAEYRMSEEMREREARRRNIILHCMGEDRNERSSGKERQEWDRKSCFNVFSGMGVTMEEDAVRFCRRVGEKKEEPRPLVCGFWDEKDRNKVLRNAWKLEETDFENVSVCPDLTRKQREEEADMRKEADRRNAEELTDNDLAKNLRWAAVGDRGQRFLVKTTAREPRTEGRGGRRTGERKSRPTVPATRGMRGTIRGGRYEKQSRPATVRRTEKETTETEESETEVETEEEMEVEDSRGKRKKRKNRSPGRTAEERPEKR